MKKNQNLKYREEREAWLLVLPLLILLVIFILIPVVTNFFYSFTTWKGIGTPQLVGFKNYIKLIQDDRFYSSLKNLGLFVLYIPIGVALPLIISAILRDGLKGWKFFRTVLYLPNILGAVLLGALFSTLLSQVGPLSEFLRQWGFESAADYYLLGHSDSARHIVAFLFVVWMRLGFGCIYFLAAMSSVDSSQYDAAKIDGAGWWKTFFNVTVPGVSFAIQFFTVLAFIEVFARMYSFIYTLTGGGPGYATYTLEFAVYRIGFNNYQRGYASAWSVVLFLFCALIALVQIRLLKKEDNA